MSTLILESDNRTQVTDLLSGDTWVVACLCAAWCDVCSNYRAHFEQLASRHPDKYFIWIDIEDQADVVGDFDVENFPTLLMQRGDIIAFYGTVPPDAGVAERLLMAQVQKSSDELEAEAANTTERQHWQQENNLLARLREASDV
jgi:thioredoxin 1